MFRKKKEEKLLRASKSILCVGILFAHMSLTGNNLNSDELAREDLNVYTMCDFTITFISWQGNIMSIESQIYTCVIEIKQYKIGTIYW